MPRASRFLASAVTIWAIAGSPAVAEPIAPNCTTSSRPLASFGPCIFRETMLLDNLTATVGGTDVSTHDQLAMTFVADPEPGEPQVLVFNYPVAGEFGFDVSPSTPLEVTYRLTTLGGSTFSSVDMMLSNLAGTGFRDVVEFLVAFNTGSTITVALGPDGDPSRFNALIADGSTSLTVRTRVLGFSPRGGGGPAFSAATDVAPIPEPATMTLIGGGLAIMLSRARRRSR